MCAAIQLATSTNQHMTYVDRLSKCPEAAGELDTEHRVGVTTVNNHSKMSRTINYTLVTLSVCSSDHIYPENILFDAGLDACICTVTIGYLCR